MYKLIVIVAALTPIILLLRTFFAGRPKKASRAFSEFNKQIDLLIWVILFMIGGMVLYSIGELIHSLWRGRYVSYVGPSSPQAQSLDHSRRERVETALRRLMRDRDPICRTGYAIQPRPLPRQWREHLGGASFRQRMRPLPWSRRLARLLPYLMALPSLLRQMARYLRFAVTVVLVGAKGAKVRYAADFVAKVGQWAVDIPKGAIIKSETAVSGIEILCSELNLEQRSSLQGRK